MTASVVVVSPGSLRLVDGTYVIAVAVVTAGDDACHWAGLWRSSKSRTLLVSSFVVYVVADVVGEHEDRLGADWTAS